MIGVVVCLLELIFDCLKEAYLTFNFSGAGSWTPLHADVFRSYSWSANVCGKKKWLFLSPSQCHLVFDRHVYDELSYTNHMF